ncbi:MAG: PilZ domain-containing protein [Deltaproteobacteria bacterium]|nr:PilZ domain-containing protein [Deltaproteobacteria bacterium]
MEKCRREYARVDVSWPASIFTSAGLIEGRVKNISIGGALINCRRLPDLEETFHVTIDIPDYLFPVAARAKQVRLNVYDSEEGSVSPSYDLAVLFLDMSEADRKVFHVAIDRACRIQPPPAVEAQNDAHTSNRIDNSLLMTVEKLSTDHGRSFKELLEEALQDLIKKYERKGSDKDQSSQL